LILIVAAVLWAATRLQWEKRDIGGTILGSVITLWLMIVTVGLTPRLWEYDLGKHGSHGFLFRECHSLRETDGPKAISPMPREISEFAKVCPRCGAERPFKSQMERTIDVLFAWLLSVSVLGLPVFPSLAIDGVFQAGLLDWFYRLIGADQTAQKET
jgi:hypothetical protein